MRAASVTAVRPAGALGLLVDLVTLAKPRITFMVVCTAVGGLWLAPIRLPAAEIVCALIGFALVVSGANALNMYLERDTDALMERTRERPLPTGHLQPEIALCFGVSTAALATVLLTLEVNPLTGFLAALSFILYVLVYTPMKRRSTWALVVGAVPGAIPPLMGWTAATGRLDAPALGLFAILFVWQIPHFIAISMFRAEEYRQAGIKVIPIERGVFGAKWRIVAYSVLLWAASIELWRLGVGGRLYLVAALVLGAIFVGLALAGLPKKASLRWARRLFVYSLAYLPALFAALLIGQTVRP